MALICLTGTPGSGKTTVAEAITSRVPEGVHVPVDFFRKMVRAGYASPHHWNAEVERQYDLARRSAAATADIYARAGFTVVVDDVIPVEVVPQWKVLLAEHSPRFVLLQPTLEIALERNESRSVWTVDPQIVRDLHRSLSRAEASADWITVDNSDSPAEEVAAQILATLEAAR